MSPKQAAAWFRREAQKEAARRLTTGPDPLASYLNGGSRVAGQRALDNRAGMGERKVKVRVWYRQGGTPPGWRG